MTRKTKNPRTKNKALVQRRCIATHQSLNRQHLLRVVRDNKGHYHIDANNEIKGRGAYVGRNPRLFGTLKKKKLLHKAFRAQVPQQIYELVERELKKSEKT